MRYLIENDAVELLEILKKNNYLIYVLCDILYRTGRRVTEVLNLKKRNIVKLDDNFYRITFFVLKKQKKTKRGCIKNIPIFVDIPKTLFVKWENDLRKINAPKERKYFFSRHSLEKEKYSNLYKHYQNFFKKNLNNDFLRSVYLIENLSFHIWRHSYAWRLKNEKGESIDGLKEALGHESIETTNKFYGSWFFDPKRRCLDF